MIDPKELRIGNWINVPVKNLVAVDGNGSPTKWSDSVNDVEITSIEDNGDLGTTAYFNMAMGCTGTTCDEAIPIPLTPEILTDWCGFIEKHQPTFSGGYDYFMKFFEQADTKGTYSTRKFTISDKTGYVFLNDHFIGRCDYLHQLQNFIHTLFEIELEIKIPAKV